MRGKRLSDEEVLTCREALTLPLHSQESPFELGQGEQELGSDDWAWLFLSLNQDYKVQLLTLAQPCWQQ